MNWVDQPRTSADDRDVVCSPRCRDCVWAVQGLVVFFIDLSFLREKSTSFLFSAYLFIFGLGFLIFGLGFLRARSLQLCCTAVFPPIFLQLRKGPF